MTGKYIVIGSEESPYSVKVRSYFRYKGIAHDWRDRGLWPTSTPGTPGFH